MSSLYKEKSQTLTACLALLYPPEGETVEVWATSQSMWAGGLLAPAMDQIRSVSAATLSTKLLELVFDCPMFDIGEALL